MTYPLGPFTVQRIGYGAMQLPGPGVSGPPRDHDAAVAVLQRAVALGVDHIDTAQYYGPDVANELIHEALHPYPESLALVSKVGARRDDGGHWLPWDGPEDLRQGIEDNLRTLDVERLAAVNLRLYDGAKLDAKFDDQLAAMVQARDDGLIAGVGLSNVTVDLLEHALESTEIICVQNAYNLVDRSSQPVLDVCLARNIAFVPFFPLGSGFGRANPVLGNDQLRDVAGRYEVTPSQVALAWTLSVADNVLLIPGTSSVEHLEQNLAAAGIRLSADDRAELTAVGANEK